MNKRRRLFEGRGKVLFEGPEPGTLVQYFKDDESLPDAQIPNGAKQATVTGKGVLNNRISEYLMVKLTEIGVPTHFMRRLNMREQLVRAVEIIPIEIVMRNVAAGEFATRLGLEEGQQLPRSIVEFHLKNSKLNNPMVTDEHITAFGWASPYELEEIMALSLRVNDYMTGLFLGIGLRLVDFKLEFGRLWEHDELRIVLADDISPDNCSLWDIRTNTKMDRDRFHDDLSKVAEAYQEIARRLGILAEGIVAGEDPNANVTSFVRGKS